MSTQLFSFLSALTLALTLGLASPSGAQTTTSPCSACKTCTCETCKCTEKCKDKGCCTDKGCEGGDCCKTACGGCK